MFHKLVFLSACLVVLTFILPAPSALAASGGAIVPEPQLNVQENSVLAYNKGANGGAITLAWSDSVCATTFWQVTAVNSRGKTKSDWFKFKVK